jgi:hypothetical protein
VRIQLGEVESARCSERTAGRLLIRDVLLVHIYAEALTGCSCSSGI